MNIKQAKDQIKNAMTAYLTKDEFGGYAIPVERQRPVFLMGPPGIGKTAIMEQVAAELGVGLVSYSMTHHTRQSALGLPFIVRKTYGGQEYDVSEYTMSEIIASVYDMMEQTGVTEGILFLDEVNCVSETLAPAMLQFLQYKVFGRHRVPEGWVVVAAGNPPEYNNSVREFDVVTWDRLRRVDVEADFGTWKEHAYASGVHPAVLTYLEIKEGDFYRVESTVDGKSFVTARGWSDLSTMIGLYEQHGIAVDEALVSQYLQNRRVAKDFAVYYDLFNKYRSDYQVDKILAGNASDTIKGRARAARFDERLSLLGLLLDAMGEATCGVCRSEAVLERLMGTLKSLRVRMVQPGADPSKLVEEQAGRLRSDLENGRQSSSMGTDEQRVYRAAVAALEEQRGMLLQERPEDAKAAFALLKKDFDRRVKDSKKQAAAVGKQMDNMFVFCEEVFGAGKEMLVLATELTLNPYAVRFIQHHGCDKYFEHSKGLMLHERQRELIARIDELELELE